MTPTVFNPTESEFAEMVANASGNVFPLAFRFPNDSLTAPGVFRKVEAANRNTFFLESVETGEKIGRYSFIGLSPGQILSFSDGQLSVKDCATGEVSMAKGDDPLHMLENYMKDYNCDRYAGLPPFWSGVVGYLGYDCVHYFEPTVGNMKPNEIGLPEMIWMIPELLIVFDHPMSQIFIVAPCRITDKAKAVDAYVQARSRVEEVVGSYLVAEASPFDLERMIASQRKSRDFSEPQGRFTRKEYGEIIDMAQRHIGEGDIFQVVPSQRYRMDVDFKPINVYRHLRHLNPSPYMFYLKFGDAVVCGSSPEVMVRCIGGNLTLKPIAGTKPRGESAERDAELEIELMSDAKELAEHMMLVDLGRNDLGKVAGIGSVSVKPSELMVVERYSHVMHIVSTVRAKLRKGLSAFDAVRAAFPAGTLSGAPKVRAMQIINELEPTRRNVYGGLCGYFGFDGNSDSCIALRMMVVNNGSAYVQAGGGLVADSKPDAEYQEIVNKAGAVLRAIQLAQIEEKREKP